MASDERGQIGSVNSGPSLSGQFRPDIEGLRAIAVVAVVLYHYKLLGVSGGYVGVDIFFVISGFLLTRQLFEKMSHGQHLAQTVFAFYAGRFRRLLPAAAVTIAATLIVAKLYAPPLQQKQIFTDGVFASVYGLNYRLAWEGTQYLHVGDAASPLQHFWSLAVEEQFYVFLPALLVASFFCFRRHLRTGLIIVLSFILISSLVACYLLTQSSQPWAYFSLHTRAWELAAGGLIAVATSRRHGLPRWLSQSLVVLGLIGIVVSLAVYTDRTVFPGIAAVLPVAGATLILLGGVCNGLPSTKVLGCAPMRYVGQMSYSWYLWHWPMLVLAPYVLGRDLDTVDRVVLLAVSFVVATQSFWVIENPARRTRMRIGRWLVAGAAGALVLCLLAYSFILTEPKVTGTGQAASSVSITGSGSAAEAAVSRALLAANTTRIVPRNLTPVLGRAPDDVGTVHSNGCHADFAQIEQATCAYGDVGASKTAVLFGDSHMEQWFPAFDAAGKTAQVKIVNWTKAGCGFTDVELYSASLNRPYTECSTWRSATIKRIVSLRPAAVYVSGAENLADGQATNTEWVAGSQRTAKVFAAAGIRVVFLEDSPRPTSLIPDCVASNLTSVQRCSFSMQRAVIKPVRHKALAAGMAAAGAVVVDPTPWLCEEGSCPAVVGNLLVWRDDNHLTATYARWLAPVMVGLLRN